MLAFAVKDVIICVQLPNKFNQKFRDPHLLNPVSHLLNPVPNLFNPVPHLLNPVPHLLNPVPLSFKTLETGTF